MPFREDEPERGIAIDYAGGKGVLEIDLNDSNKIIVRTKRESSRILVAS